MNKKNCDNECNGVIKELKVKGLDFPTKIVVEYEVKNQNYMLEENLAMKKDRNLLLGFIPIGYKTKSLIEIKTGSKAIVGNNVKVKYEESNPSNAYLIDNKATITWD